MVVNTMLLDSSKGAITTTSEKSSTERDFTLRALYCISSGLSLFQVGWFFSLPTTVLSLNLVSTAAAEGMERKFVKMTQMSMGMTEGGGRFFARSFIWKYYGHKLVGLTHILPAPLWAAIVPFQLHPASRSPPYKKLHRTLGSVFFALSASLMVGVGTIFGRGLQQQVGAAWAAGIEGKLRRKMPLLLRSSGPALDPFMFMSSAWFIYTLQRSLRAAWKKKFAEHEDWVMRHIAAGQWVALMRILTLTAFIPLSVFRYGDSQDVQVSAFSSASYTAWAMCIAGGEVAVARVRKNRVTAKAAAAAKRKLAQGPRNGAEFPAVEAALGA